MTIKWEEVAEKRLLEYMAIQSTTGAEEQFAERVVADLEENSWTVEKQFIPGTNRFNIYASYKNSEPHEVKVLLNTHLDTVPPYIAPTQDDKNIYGRGSNDAKGQMTAMVTAATILSQTNEDVARRTGLLFVVGEEYDHVGMIEANKLGITADYLIVGEPTELKFGTIQKGAFKVRLTANGVAGHSGYPDSGKSAIHLLIDVLHDVIHYNWPKDDTYGATTFNVGKINGGQALNAWAENASADIFFRVTTSCDQIHKILEGIVAKRVDIEPLSFNDPVVLNKPPFDAPTDQVAFNTDLPYFDARDKLKGKFLFGAGSIKNAHSKDEFMPKSELHECTATLVKCVTMLAS